MNHYPRHIGDWMRDTAHLSEVEECIYSRMIDQYYSREKPLPAEKTGVCRLVRATTREARKAVDVVLAEFFALEPDGWHQKRCDAELAKFGEKSAKAAKSAAARWGQPQGDGNANAHANASANAMQTHMRTHSEGNATHQPPPNSQEPEPINPQGIPPPRTTDGEGNALPPLPDEPTSIADLSNYLTRRGMQPQRLAYAPNRILLNRWLTEGVTWAQLDAAYAEAERTLKGEPPAAPGYLDTILKRLSTQQTRRSIHDERAETIRAFTTPSAPEQRTERDITDVTERVD